VSGAGVWVYSSVGGANVDVSNSDVTDNQSSGYGGGIFVSTPAGGSLTIENTTISDNTSSLGGGGVSALTQGAVTISQSTLSNNSAYSAGALGVAQAASVDILNSTIAENSATVTAGGILSNVDLIITSSVIASNSASDSPGIWADERTITMSHSLVADVGGLITIVDEGGNIDGTTDPLLGPLTGGGGTPNLDVHIPQEGSPLVDAGIDQDPSLATDQRGSGFPRAVGAGVDIGAIESDIVLLGDTDGDGTPDDEDAFPNNPDEDTDTDGDGTGDNADDFPSDPDEDTDTDGDGTGNNADDFPSDPDEDTDTDGDGTGDNRDAFPNDPDEDTDTDGDGVGDNADLYPDDPNRTDLEIVPVTTLPSYLLGVLSGLLGLFGLRARSRRRR
jgi:hypothetical protein